MTDPDPFLDPSTSREHKLELALRLVHFELSTMPPLPGIGMPFGITSSLKTINKVLFPNENPQTTPKAQ
jgi:hypothetical protein